MNSEQIFIKPGSSGNRPPPTANQPIAKAWGYDRARIMIDRPLLPGPFKDVLRACGGGLAIVPGRLKFNPVWQCTVDLYQPSQLALNIFIDECLGSKVSALLTYVEIAHDLIFEREALAIRYESHLFRHLVMRHQRGIVVRYKHTNYFNRFTDASASKRGRVGVIYTDKPSKLNTVHAGKPCIHMECRITGSAKLAAVGLGSVGDLVSFDFRNFWNSAVALYELPSKSELGLIVGGPAGRDVSGTALRKRAGKFIDECSIDGQFFMHNAVRQEPRLLRKLEKLPLELLHLPPTTAMDSSD